MTWPVCSSLSANDPINNIDEPVFLYDNYVEGVEFCIFIRADSATAGVITELEPSSGCSV